MSESTSITAQPLTKYPPASFRELTYLSIPLILSLFSASFMGFCDRLFLAKYSLIALEGSVSAGYLCILFQHPIIRICTMTQVFVGLYRGANRDAHIGPSTWQMIWCSLFSTALTLPLGLFVASFYFKGTSISAPAMIYFKTLLMGNFLFPLGATLTSYFVGMGKTRIIVFTTLFSHGLNLVLDYFLIFGVPGILAPQGVFGAAIATGISQLLFCVILFFAFIEKKQREKFNTGRYFFQWENFLEQFKIGLPRGIARVILLASWVSIARIMTLKGGDHLLVLSIGGTLTLLFVYINDGMLQAMITIASNLMGKKDYKKIWKMVRSSLIHLFITGAVIAIPCIIYRESLLKFFFPLLPTGESFEVVKNSCIWLWLYLFCYGYHAIGLSLITASRDVTFYMCTIMFIWIVSYLPVYLAMEIYNWAPDTLWIIMGFESLIFGTIFLIRASKEKWKQPHSEFSFEKLSI